MSTYLGDTVAKRKILVIDDDALVLKRVEAFFRQRGFTVVTCEDGREAHDRFLAEGPFKAVICDWQMPDFTGDQVYLALKRILGRVPFFLYTGSQRGSGTSTTR